MYLKDPSIDPSTSSSQLYFNENKEFVKELLKSRIFLGRYIERRLFDKHIGYRDVVLVSSAEHELKKDLREILQKLKSTFIDVKWIGISDTEADPLHNWNLPTGILLWTEIDNQPFGVFWFQIRNIKFREDEIIVTLKCLRHISEAFLEVEPILCGTENKNHVTNKSYINGSQIESLTETYGNIMENLRNSLSINNIRDFFTFICALVIAVFTGSTSFINFVGNFVLALVREMSILIKNSTPMILGILDFVSKIVGGLYILLAMLFRSNSPMTINKRKVGYYETNHRHTSRFDPRYID